MSTGFSIHREPYRPGPLCYQWKIVLGGRMWLVTVQPFKATRDARDTLTGSSDERSENG